MNVSQWLSTFAPVQDAPVYAAFGCVIAAVVIECLQLVARRRALVRASRDEAEDASDEAEERTAA